MRAPRGRRARRLVTLAAALHLGAHVVAAQAAAPPGVRPAARVHEVAPGDTLGALARRYGVSVTALVAANRLASARVTLRIGQRLAIPPPGPRAVRAPAARVPPPAAPGRRGAHAPRGPRLPSDVALAIPEFAEASGLGWPVEGAVTSPFGRRRSGWHRGVDIKAERGTPIVAAAPGIVIASGWEGRYGRVVKIEHDDGLVTLYAHNDANLVRVGDRVAAGERIASVGRTGRATTHHLHFEVRHDGRAWNPLYLLPLPPRVAGIEETGENEDDE